MIHQGKARVNEEKIIMTPVTPDQSIRGLEPTWSIVTAPPVVPQNPTIAQESLNRRPNVVGPILICIFLMLSYISCSAVLMAMLQSWSLLDTFYFCFMSIFTVGLGDLQFSHSNLTAVVIYIFIGLILVSTCGHIFYEEVFLRLNDHRTVRAAARQSRSQSKDNVGGGKGTFAHS